MAYSEYMNFTSQNLKFCCIKTAHCATFLSWLWLRRVGAEIFGEFNDFPWYGVGFFCVSWGKYCSLASSCCRFVVWGVAIFYISSLTLLYEYGYIAMKRSKLHRPNCHYTAVCTEVEGRGRGPANLQNAGPLSSYFSRVFTISQSAQRLKTESGGGALIT